MASKKSSINRLVRLLPKRTREIITIVIVVIVALLSFLPKTPLIDPVAEFLTLTDQGAYVLNTIDVTAEAYEPVIINNNVPLYGLDGLDIITYEKYSNLDFLGRCGPAIAMLGKDLMPEGERESISSVKPSGWNNESYPETAKACSWDQNYWANRCHLLAYALTGENANEKNLITGSRQMNMNMLTYESMLIDYIRNNDYHVLYRVTPVFVGAEMVARGVLMEAYSVEDEGESIQFCVWVPNQQSCLSIDYRNGSTATEQPN